MTNRTTVENVSTLIFAFVPMFASGCGQGTYEKLMKEQMGTLGTWREFVVEDLGFLVKLPEGANRTVQPQDLEGADEVTVEQPWQSVFFRVKASRADSVDLESEASSTEKFYVDQGYTLDSQQAGRVDRISTIDLDFSKEDADAMTIRIAHVGSAVVHLTMTGATIKPNLKSQFFNSLALKPKTRR